ncbi:hypothetical protein EsH8_X_000604 [Colletotrichum jinshuiense]
MDTRPTEKDPLVAAQKVDRLRRMYGKVPARSDLLHNQLHRKYFDSGDFALQDAHKSSNIGPIQTGAEHPLRRNISHPSAPVPTSSNVDDDANKHDTKVEKNSNFPSHLRQEAKGARLAASEPGSKK